MIFSKRTYLLLFITAFLFVAFLLFLFSILPSRNYTRQSSYTELYPAEGASPEDLKKWESQIRTFTPAELEQAGKISITEAKIDTTDSDFEKLKKIGGWLKMQLSHVSFGQPTDFFENQAVLQQFDIARTSDSINIWCGTFARFMHLFSVANGLHSRYMGCVNKNDHHVINETYIPELKKWLFTDIMLNAIYCINKSGEYLNTADLLLLNLKNDTTPVWAAMPGNNDTLIRMREVSPATWEFYMDSSSTLYYYYDLSPKSKIYSFAEKTKRYIYPKVWYEVFKPTPVSNKSFYVRTGILYSGILFFILLCISIVNDRSKKHTENLWRKSSHQ